MNQTPSLVVFYNTRCPVCDYGITRQKSRLLEAVKSGRIAFRDINIEPEALSAYGADIEAVRKRLHAIDNNNCMIVGTDVAIAIWKFTPGEKWLAALFGNRFLLPLTRMAYDIFASALYSWNRRKGHW